MNDQDGQQKPKEHADAKGGNNPSTHIGRRIAVGVGVVVDLLFSFLGLWPEHHVSALILGFAGLIAATATEWPAPRRWLPIAAVLAAIAFAINYYAGTVFPVETETHGWLMPGSEPTPFNGCTGRPIPSNALLFIAGTNGAWTTSSGTTLLNVADTDVLSFRRAKNDGLLFDMDMYDKQGNLIFRIERNEFHLIPGTYSYQMRSPDRSQLVVYDNKGYVLLYIGYLNKNTVRIAGQFYGSDGTEVQINRGSVFNVNNHNEYGPMNCTGNFGRIGFAFYRK
jgi:hypothetical protein